MKVIKALSDIRELNEQKTLPQCYLNLIKSELISWLEAESDTDNPLVSSLTDYSCIYHLEGIEDTQFLSNMKSDIEFIEIEEINESTSFRIGLRRDHEMSIVYFLKGALDAKFEQWLCERGK
ncbi:hypothetical protein IMZ08_07390 [Bacillus luteolus]|uniref:Uncharacterized protein n=1 Tax=Litchfieldia luteola TaxID=682179 RepID=A0ABR9QHG4_9BACI|nr:hypothetical protein [Cytobacillus luteolus]MBE4907876.1 hypothetical protein [Cytobacillus luteolus]MBP1943966.1 hypothetical protein [Cytobacillus luteolus]